MPRLTLCHECQDAEIAALRKELEAERTRTAVEILSNKISSPYRGPRHPQGPALSDGAFAASPYPPGEWARQHSGLYGSEFRAPAPVRDPVAWTVDMSPQAAREQPASQPRPAYAAPLAQSVSSSRRSQAWQAAHMAVYGEPDRGTGTWRDYYRPGAATTSATTTAVDSTATPRLSR